MPTVQHKQTGDNYRQKREKLLNSSELFPKLMKQVKKTIDPINFTQL